MNESSQIRIYTRSEVVIFRVTNGEFGALSNMAPDFPIEIAGVRIPTVEALYQACRFPDRPDIQTIIVDQPSPMTAKMKSKKFRNFTRPDWDQNRVKIMRWCLRAKLAQNWEKFGTVLTKTGLRPIVEESRKDDFWGAKPKDDGTLVGMNVVGRLLMELREQLYSPESSQLKTVERPNIPNFLFLGKPIDRVESRNDDHMSNPVQFSMLGQ